MKRSQVGSEGAFDTYADDFWRVHEAHSASRTMNRLTLVEPILDARSARIDLRLAMRFATREESRETRCVGGPDAA
jgi:hypothetical protein